MENPRLTLFVLQMVNFAGSSGYAILIPLYPPLAKSKGISDATIGYIFCLYPVGGFIVSILLGSVMTVQSMKKIMLCGLILTLIGMVGMGLVAYIENTMAFILVSASLRLITGIGATCCFTPSYGMATHLFKESITKVTSQLQIMSGVATFSGPLFGSVFYLVGEHTPIGGFSLPMYALSLIYLMTIPLLQRNLNVSKRRSEFFSVLIHDYPVENLKPSNLKVIMEKNQRPTTGTKSKQSVLSAVLEQLRYYHIFKIRSVMLTFFTHVLLFTAALGARTYFAVYLQESYGLSESQSTLIFLFNTVVRGFTAYFVGKIHNINKRKTLTLGLFISSLCYFFYGPDTELTGLPHRIWVVCLADGLFGLGNGIFGVCLIGEYISIIRQRYPNCNDDVSSMASALYISGWTLGEFTGPLIGGNLMEYFPFERVCVIFGFAMLINFAVYFVFFTMTERRKTRGIDKTFLIETQEQETN